MANPLVRAGIKLAVKGGKKIAKKIKTKRKSMNSTDNMTKGPIDKSINKHFRYTAKFGDKVTKELDIQDFKKNWDGSAQLAIKKRKLK